MPTTVQEKFGRVLSDASAEVSYVIRGAASDIDARAELLAASPTEHDGLKRDDAEVEELGDTLWLGVVRYVPASRTQREPGESTFAFETRGGTQHVTQSLQTVGTYAAPGTTAPDFGGAIGVQGDRVEGVDLTLPVYTFSETHWFNPNDVTNAYKGTLFQLTGCVNSGAFRGLAAGECLFLGAAGTRRGTQPDDLWEIGFAFAGSPNVTGLTIGEITGVAKKGWEYLWARYETAEDEDARLLIQKPIAAYVEQVYRTASFAGLGIGS